MASEVQRPDSPAIEPADGASAGEVPPRECVFVTGPRADDVARWLRQSLGAVSAERPDIRSAVLLAATAGIGYERFTPATAAVAVEKVDLPCVCCPWVADVPNAARTLVATAGAQRLFVIAPLIAAGALLAQFDRDLGWRRRFVVCLDENWAAARRQERLSPFQASLLGLANAIVGAPPRGDDRPVLRAAAFGSDAAVPVLTLS